MKLAILLDGVDTVQKKDGLDRIVHLVVAGGLRLADVVGAVHQMVNCGNAYGKSPEEETARADGGNVLRRYTMPKEETVDSVGVAECRRRTESVGGRHTLNCTDERPDEGDCW